MSEFGNLELEPRWEKTPGQTSAISEFGNLELAAQVKAWRGKVAAHKAAEILGISPRTLEGVEQGRGFNYPKLLRHALRTIRVR